MIIDKFQEELSKIAPIAKTNNHQALFDDLDRKGMLNERNLAKMIFIIAQEMDVHGQKPNQK
jgi:hypothetical protein